jgi:hypothetical protein
MSDEPTGFRSGFGPAGPAAAGDVPSITFPAGRAAVPGPGDRAKIADRLQPGRIGVEVSEEFPLQSEQFTSEPVMAAIIVRAAAISLTGCREAPTGWAPVGRTSRTRSSR